MKASSPNQRQEDCPELAKPAKADDWRPKRLVRTVLASIAESKVFGKQMEREAKRRRFFEATAKAFLGMGCPGTGQSGRSTSPTSRRSWISSTC